MKKFYILAVLLSAGTLINLNAGNKEKLLGAIKAANPQDAKKFLRRLGPVEPKEKKELLEAAEDAIDDLEGRVSLKKSRQDLSQVIGGMTCSLSCAILAAMIIVEGKKGAEIGGGLFGTMAALFGYLTLKGIMCSSAKARVAQANQVYEIIQGAELKTEVPVPAQAAGA